LLAAALAGAQDAVTARSQGMGNSSYAAPGEGEAIFLNPAALPWLRRPADQSGKHPWSGYATTAYNFADTGGPAARVSSSRGWLFGAGATNGRHGIAAYIADMNTLQDDREEIGLGYGFSFSRNFAIGLMLRQLRRTIGIDVEVTDFTFLYNIPLRDHSPLTFTVAVRDPYEHDQGLMFDLAAAAYVTPELLVTAHARDLSERVHRLLNVGAELQVRPGWFVRTGFEETPRKSLQGISVGAGHRVGDWQFDLAVTNWQSNLKNTSQHVGATVSAGVAF